MRGARGESERREREKKNQKRMRATSESRYLTAPNSDSRLLTFEVASQSGRGVGFEMRTCCNKIYQELIHNPSKQKRAKRVPFRRINDIHDIIVTIY